MYFDKYRHLYKLIAIHQREIVDPTLLFLTSAELTAKAKDRYCKIEPGGDIYARGFLNMQKDVQKKMNYSIEDIISNNSQLLAGMFIQLSLVIIFLQDFSIGHPYLVPSNRMTLTICRVCCAMVLHCQTQKVIRQGL